MDNNQNGFDYNSGGQQPLYTQAASFQDEITPKNGFAIASLVLGILSILCCCQPMIGGICSILALIFSIVSRKQNGRFNGLSIAGLVLAIIGLLLFAYMLVCEILVIMFPELIEDYLKELENMGVLEPDAILHFFRS